MVLHSIFGRVHRGLRWRQVVRRGRRCQRPAVAAPRSDPAALFPMEVDLGSVSSTASSGCAPARSKLLQTGPLPSSTSRSRPSLLFLSVLPMP